MTEDEIKGSAGGKARAALLSEEEKKRIAKEGAIARWGFKATHKGNFKEDFGIDVECYVLNDDNKTAVISQSGMARTLGLSPRGNALPKFLASKAMSDSLGDELREKIAKPVKFQWGSGGAEQPPTSLNGFDVTLLIDICKAIIKAGQEKKLLARQERVIQQAQIIINASAKSGIQNLVYRLAGYNATREETIAAFKLFVQEEAREYEREFPEPLYQQWYRLYELPKPGRSKPWKFKHLTLDQVYKPLAKSRGKILKLAQDQRSDSTGRHKKLHQFLSEVGVKALRQHLGQLLGIAQISKNKEEYEKHVKTIFGDQRELDV